MRWPALFVVLLLSGALLATPEPKPTGRTVTLVVPQPISQGQRPSLRVTVGPLQPRERVVVRSASGKILGAISPFGGAAAKQGGTYTLPVPEELLRGRSVSLVLTLEQEHGKADRIPSEQEIKRIELQRGH